MNRTNQIILTGVVGIIVNIILAGFKYAVGIKSYDSDDASFEAKKKKIIIKKWVKAV